MKNNKLSLILLTSITSILIISLLSVNVLGSNNLTYIIEKDIIYDTSSISYNSTFNIRNQTIINAINFSDTTYSFTDDSNGGNPAGWGVYEGTGTSVNVIASVGGRLKVLELFDSNSGTTYYAAANQSFTSRDNGTIELWTRFSGQLESRYFQIADSTLGIVSHILYTSDGGDWLDGNGNTIGSYVINQWYHIRITFDASADTFNIWIDGIHLVNDGSLPVDLSTSLVGNFRLATRGWGTVNDYWIYVDAIGYSWDDNYSIGQNYHPTPSYTNTREVANDEFNFDNSGIQYDLGAIGEGNYVNNWIVDNDPYDDITIIESPEGYDRELKFYSDTVHFRTIEKYISITTDGFLNMSMTINYLEMNNPDSNLWWGMYNGSTDTEVALIRIILTSGNIELESLDSNKGGYTNLMTLDNSVNLIRKFSMLINEQNTVYLRYQDNSSVDCWFTFEKVFGNVNVYNKMIFISRMNDEATTQTTHIDSMSLTINGTTQNYVNDYSIYLSDMNISNWNSLHNNIVEINGTGSFSFGVYSDGSFSSPKGVYNYSNFKIWNVYDTPFNYSNPMLSFITNHSITVESVIIHGVKLTEGSNVYWLEFTYGNVDIDESYFYATTGHYLHFKLYVNDNNTEWIQANFNIPDITSENRSISFSSNINGFSSGYFGVDYSDTTITYIPFPSHATTNTLILPQTKFITNLLIQISDNDNSFNDYCSGYVSNIQLLYYPDISVSITTLNLISVMIPIMIMLVPTFGVYTKYGKNSILPMFILMSIICFATQLIPTWLFFIIIICSGAFLFMKERGRLE